MVRIIIYKLSYHPAESALGTCCNPLFFIIPNLGCQRRLRYENFMMVVNSEM